MNKQYFQNIRNIKPQPQTAAEPQPQYQPTNEGDAGTGWPKASIYDIDLKEFFGASTASTDDFIRQTMAHHKALDQADAAAAAEAVFGPGVGGYGVVEESEPATETFADQF
jgi:hypothetical protein